MSKAKKKSLRHLSICERLFILFIDSAIQFDENHAKHTSQGNQSTHNRFAATPKHFYDLIKN